MRVKNCLRIIYTSTIAQIFVLRVFTAKVKSDRHYDKLNKTVYLNIDACTGEQFIFTD